MTDYGTDIALALCIDRQNSDRSSDVLEAYHDSIFDLTEEQYARAHRALEAIYNGALSCLA